MSNLLAGENLILKTHQHWIWLVKNLIIPAAAVVVAILLDFTILSPNYSGCEVQNGFCPYTPKLRTIFSLVVLALALLWLIVVWIRWQAISYTLTDQRIKIESGVFSRQEKIIPIDRVQDCMTKQSLVGRLIGYGRVEVDAAGAQGAEVLAHLPDPGTFRDQVFVQSEKRRGAGAQGQPPPAPSGV